MFEKIRDILAEQLFIEKDKIKMDSTFKEDLMADSLELFDLVMSLEEEYDMEIDENDLMNIHTVGDIVNYLESKGIKS